jgi:hypothetical protein
VSDIIRSTPTRGRTTVRRHTGVVEQVHASTTLARPVRTRIRGLDMARALAIVGMVMIHIGPARTPGGGLAGAAYRAAHGRAAIMFIVLAGVGVSLLVAARDDERIAATRERLAWRALVLLPAGIALQTLDVNVAVILQYYAAYFVVAALAITLSDRVLLIVAGLAATVGPVLLIIVERIAPGLFIPGVPQWSEIGRIVRDVFVTGYYPVLVWTAPLLVGMWIGRRDLRSPTVARTMTAAGACVAAIGFVVSDALVATVGPAATDGDWRTLYVIEPHNEMPLWLLTATGIAVAVIGACLLLARVAPRTTWPLTALGQLALTAYIAHLLVLDLWPATLLRDTYAAAWLSVGRFTLVALVAATAYRAIASRGPFELLLRPPAALTR